MPDGLVPDIAGAKPLVYWLQQALDIDVFWKIMLWHGDYVPDRATTKTFLPESTWGGYHRIDIDRSVWQAPALVGTCWTIQYGAAPIVWDVTSNPGSQEVSGWAIIDELDQKIQYVERFETIDILAPPPGGKYKLPPLVTMTNAACPPPVALSRRALPVVEV